ncbi:hypothetical protein JHL17_12925 [Azospirillum sp. YIM B02556]|uniref:histidine kinase n=1 Tax=Azospirillum endophyticum TaxID=2800326 RepID=A0ABS1F4I3_9PROT|nr:hypothetical protein [Azospirillum endophyticum]MBK1838319.1 hypothetical protein [Azospirillum endophyticum]
MSPSDPFPSRPAVPSASPVSDGRPAGGRAAPVLAALGGAAVLLLSALDPVRDAIPWALPLLAAGSGAAAGLMLLSVRRAHRRSSGREGLQRPDAAVGPASSPTPSAVGKSEADAVRIAALEEALREKDRQMSQRLRSQQIAAMDARAELAGAIVHDMNNALGAVAGYADFLVSDLPSGSPQADYASRVVTAVDRVRPGLRGLVSAARMEPVPLKTERAAHVLDEAATILRKVPTPPGSLAVRNDAGTPDPICNADLLARTLAGLAAEILAATGRGGEARLCLRTAAYGSFRAGQAGQVGGDDEYGDAADAGWTVRPLLTPHAGLHALFELRIDGPPPTDEVLAALVDPLLSARTCYRRGQADQDEMGGWPAALATARRLDGGLSLLTHPAEGVAVRFHIPAALPPESGPAAFPAHLRPPSKHCITPAYKVLVVDADPASGDRFQAGLERQGFEVSVCDDLRDALDVVADEPGFFDALVIGPGLSALPAGAALAARLKALRPDLPCVLYGSQGTGPGGDGAGGPADLLLPLPVDLPRLARGVAALAAGGARHAAGGGTGTTGERR